MQSQPTETTEEFYEHFVAPSERSDLLKRSRSYFPHHQTSAQFVREVIRARAARRQFFGVDLFADPAWDMLLELYALHREQHRTSVSKLAVAAGIPGTTALRWLDRLQDDGLLVRQQDPLDARRIWIGLSDAGVAAMESYLLQLRPTTMPL